MAQPQGQPQALAPAAWLPLLLAGSHSSGSSLGQGLWLSLCAALISTGLETASSHCQSGFQCQMLPQVLEPGPWRDLCGTTPESCSLEEQVATCRRLQWLNLSQPSQEWHCLLASGCMADDTAAGGRWQRCEQSARLGLDRMGGENHSQQYHCAAHASPGK